MKYNREIYLIKINDKEIGPFKTSGDVINYIIKNNVKNYIVILVGSKIDMNITESIKNHINIINIVK